MNLRRNFSIVALAVLLLSSCQATSLKQTTQTGQDPIRINPVNVQTSFINQQAISPQALEIDNGNLFDNSGFENGLEGWTACTDGAIKLSGNAFEGSNALEVIPYNCFYRSAEVNPNQDLVLSCYVKVTSGSGWTGMGMGFADSNWSTVGEAPTTVISGTEYARYDVKATTPANTKYASMWLYSENPTVVDNCTLMLESEPPTPPTPPTPNGSNLLENGDFETLDTANNPTEWSQDCGGSWNVSSEYSNELNLTGGVCVDQGLSAGDVATLSGKEYTYSCYATNNGGYASISIFFDDVPVSKEIPKGQYQLIELKGTAPQASSGFVSIYSEGNLVVDDCSLTIDDAQPSVCVDPVNIPDPFLETLILTKLNNPNPGPQPNPRPNPNPSITTITCADLQNLTSLDNRFNQRGVVKSLEGLQHAINLKGLALRTFDLPTETLTDLTPLKNLTKLQSLVLTNYIGIQDLSPIESLIDLQVLVLEGIKPLNFDFLTRLNKLINFTINRAELETIPQEIENLRELRNLALTGNKLSSISFLVNNPQIFTDGVFSVGNPLSRRLILFENCLDISTGSQTLADIQILQDRGIDVTLSSQGGNNCN